jgi:hypothetical protein
MRTNLLLSALLLPLLGLGASACSRADALCGLVCDCSHCNDWDETKLCEQISLSQDVASDYGCDSAWDSWAECFENNGQCYADLATYATRELGSCNTHVDMQIACSNNDPCTAADPNGFCSNGACVYKVCNNATDQACTSHGQCPSGPDKCEQVALVLLQCEQQAADINVTPIYPPEGH